MLVESHLKDKAVVIFDCESVSSIDKGGLHTQGHPDRILPAMVTAIKAVAREIGDAVSIETLPAPSSMEVRFALKVDANGIVSLSRSEDDSHMKILLRFG